MAETSTLPALSPRQLGKHLREVRRRKGLSLSEVARGAGLKRRELHAYEKGTVAIPDSDLFVLAGSCGVDVSELRPPQSLPELEAGAPTSSSLALAAPSSIEDSVKPQRLRHEAAAPVRVAPSGRRRLRAVGTATPTTPPRPESDWRIDPLDPLDEMMWPQDVRVARRAASVAPAPADPVDVFEELAGLPASSPIDVAGPTNPTSAPPVPSHDNGHDPDFGAAAFDGAPPSQDFGSGSDVAWDDGWAEPPGLPLVTPDTDLSAFDLPEDDGWVPEDADGWAYAVDDDRTLADPEPGKPFDDDPPVIRWRPPAAT